MSWRTCIGVLCVCASVATALARSHAPAAPPQVAPRLQQLIATHCTGCHDESHVLNLKKLPAASDQATWASVLDEVSSGSMPPPKDDSIVDRFPLDPSVRADIMRMVEPLAITDHVPAARFITSGAWTKAATRLASGVIEPKEIAELAAPANEAAPSTTGRMRNLSPELQQAFDRASIAVCTAIAAKAPGEADVGKPSLVPTASTPAMRDASIELMETRLFGIARAREIKRSAARYDSFLARTKDVKQAWTMLCMLNLSGPRLIYGPYVRGTTDE